MKKLYNEEELNTMIAAEDAKIMNGSRVEELKKFARIQGIKRIGIANCAMFTKEAELLKKNLESEFEVFAVGCKMGGISSQEMTGRESKSVSCNPAGQAQFLADNNTELNISMGLCVGHDIIFNSKSKAMTTNLIVKDRKYKHNSMKNFEENE